MKKRLLYAASVAAIALTACTSEEYLGGVDSQGANTVIGFSSETKSVTRAQATGSTAAEKLNNNFIVYGFKTNNDNEAADGSTDQKVFDLYNVNYEAGSAYTTESNTAGWEYVGFANHDGSINPQTIKYWDRSAKSYVFSAVSGPGITATKIEKDLTSGATVYDKGWKVEIPAGGSLGDLYASDRKVVNNINDYGKQVDLTFRSLVSKVRFAIYETVPGYEVKINRFWTDQKDVNPKYSDSNFAIKGDFKTANASASTPLTITYYDATVPAVENRAKVTFNDADVTARPYGIFGDNIQSVQNIGTTSAEATYDQAEKAYTMILPYENTSNILKLKVNYTLTSTDGSGEKIYVYGATAYVPAEYTQWKPNYAYTYIFKISDKTNGTTVTPTDPDDPNDPAYTDPDDPDYDPNDPDVGLSPITFDAVVITDETDVQETITTVGEASITTYQKGTVVTANNEYVAPDSIFVTVMKKGSLQDLTAAVANVYEVVNKGTETLSESVTENYLKNFCTLTKVTVDRTIKGALSTDGTCIKFPAGKVMSFIPVTGKTYAVEFVYGTSKAATVADYNAATGESLTQVQFDALTDAQKTVSRKTYKIIKVVGSATTPTYTLTDATAGDITTVAGKHVLTLKQGTEAVLGAAPNFTISSTNGNNALKISAAKDADNNDVYEVSVDQVAIAAGKANDTYTVTYGTASVTITVGIPYAFNDATPTAITEVTVVAGNTTGATFTNMINNVATDGVVTDVPDGITIEKTANAGEYKVTAASNVAYGSSYTAKISGQPLTIKVDSYSFADLVINNQVGGGSTGTLILKKNDAAITGASPAEFTTNPADPSALATVAAGTNGEYTVTANDGSASGTFYVYYENAKAKVTINSYSIDAVNPIYFGSSATFGVKNGSKTVSVAAADFVISNKPTDVTCSTVAQYNKLKRTTLDETAFDALSDEDKIIAANATVTSNGQVVTFSGATVPGSYTIDYKVGTTVVAQVTIVVNE